MFSYACTDINTFSTSQCNKDDITAKNLISIQDAFEIKDNENILFLEVSKESEYLKGHLPNALHVWRPDFRAKEGYEFGGMRCTYKELLALLQRLGLKANSNVLLYDAKGGSDAMRLAWVFDYYNFKNYQVINGGKKAWLQSGFELEQQNAEAIPNPDFRFSPRIDNDILADAGEVLTAILSDETILVDTRESYEYLGNCFVKNNVVHKYKKGAYARGCILSAVHLNWSELADLSVDDRIKCTKDLEYNLAKKGITKDKEIIVYCQSGSRSSHTAFVLKKVLGYPKVKNYDGSWIEWSYLKMIHDESLTENESAGNILLNKMSIKEHTKQKDFDKEFARLEASLSKN